jgi:ribosomal protein L11
MILMLDVAHTKKCFLVSNSAEPSPPLGTILGNLGVNTVKFCEEFNLFTKNLPKYFFLKVIIYIFGNRSFKFEVLSCSTGFLLNLLKFEKVIRIYSHDRYRDKNINCIYLKDVIKIALFKFPNIDVKQSILCI